MKIFINIDSDFLNSVMKIWPIGRLINSNFRTFIYFRIISSVRNSNYFVSLAR